MTDPNRRFHVGAQNDALYITSGQPPAINNDYPNHEADRTCVAKVFDEGEAKRLVELANRTIGHGPDSCLAKRKYDEPCFTLLGRDPVAASLVSLWSIARDAYLLHPTEPERILDSIRIAARMKEWCVVVGRAPADVLDLLPKEMLVVALAKRGCTVRIEDPGGIKTGAGWMASEAPARAASDHPVHAGIMPMNQGTPCMTQQGSSLKPADESLDSSGGLTD
jgi:hypothetical protein